MPGQYLTAVFELRPTRRKAAALEGVRTAAEAVFWHVLAGQRARADAVAAISERKGRRMAWRAAQADLAHAVLAAGARSGLAELVVNGLVRDGQMAIGSYIELRAGGHEAEWPTPLATSAANHVAALDQLPTASVGCLLSASMSA